MLVEGYGSRTVVFPSPSVDSNTPLHGAGNRPGMSVTLPGPSLGPAEASKFLYTPPFSHVCLEVGDGDKSRSHGGDGGGLGWPVVQETSEVGSGTDARQSAPILVPSRPPGGTGPGVQDGPVSGLEPQGTWGRTDRIH